ncbi:MAG TPA: hypothetical protein VN931_06800 [Fibrobacteria bacterium]|nr:hypothetical protein [Fibrobacteria bacterium]
MRKIVRYPLGKTELKYLVKRQGDADSKLGRDELIVDRHWSSSIQARAMRKIRTVLGQMAGSLESCMYCSHSHGSDIDHFWPKRQYHAKMYDWMNYLLCCTECGRIKGVKFPLDPLGNPLLINPSVLDPWEHLDFDPSTGNITSRYITPSSTFSLLGDETVKALELDQREALSKAYQLAYSRIVDCIREYLGSTKNEEDRTKFSHTLGIIEDKGLLGWTRTSSTSKMQPFQDLRKDALGWSTLQSI